MGWLNIGLFQGWGTSLAGQVAGREISSGVAAEVVCGFLVGSVVVLDELCVVCWR